MPKELRNCRKWEKDRRDRLKAAFDELSKVLPCYDPSITISKIDILQKSTVHIRELEDKIKKLVSNPTSSENGSNKNEKDDIVKKLHDRIKKLLTRNEQLCNLLKDAGITVPSACGTVKKFKNTLPWSNKISPEQAKILQKKELEKENDAGVKKSQPKKKKIKTTTTSIAPKHRKASVNRVVKVRNKGKTKNLNKTSTSTSNCVIVISQASQPCYIITNAPSNTLVKTTSSTVITNSTLLSTPLMSSNVKPYTSTVFTSTNPPINTLGPGTLILANGTILPVLPPAQTVLPNPTILNTFAQNNSTVIVVSKSITTPTSSTVTQRTVNSNVTIKKVQQCNTNVKSMVKLKPKYCLTNTTQVNKVPIPALTSRYANNSIVLTEIKTNKPKKCAKEKTEVKKATVKRTNEEEIATEAKKSKKDDENNSKDNATDLQCVQVEKMIESVTAEKTNEIVNETIDNTEKEVEQLETRIESQPPEVIVEESVKETETLPLKEVSTSENNIVINEPIVTLAPVTLDLPSNEVPVTKEPPISVQSSTTVDIVSESQEIKHLDLNLPHSELSNDIFASLQVPTGCQNPDSTSPTAAFLLAFPLVSSNNGVKVTEVIDDENTESQRGTPTLLQIGTMETTKVTQSQSDSLSSNFLNLDNFSFFSSKDMFYSCNTYSGCITTTTSNSTTVASNLTQELPHCTDRKVPKTRMNYNKEKLSNNLDLNINFDPIRNPPLELSSLTNEVPNYHVNKSKSNTEQIPKTMEVKSSFPNQNKTYSQCNFTNNVNETTTVNSYSYTNVSKNYTTPLYTTSNNYSYNYHSDTNFNQNYYKNIPKTDTRSYYPLTYNNYQDYRKNDAQCTTNYSSSAQNYQKEKVPNVSVKVKQTNQNKQPINWMTTPDNRLQTCTTDYFLPTFTKEADFNTIYPTNSFVSVNQTNYFNTSSMYTTSDINNSIPDTRKSVEIPIVPVNQRIEMEENQFSWSPTKIPQFLDPPHSFVPSSLPTLVSELPLPFQEQKIDLKFPKERKERRPKTSSYENHTNFLSVSQLVDHNKPETVPARTATRRNSGNRSKNNAPKVKQRVSKSAENKQDKNHLKTVVNYNDLFCDVPKTSERSIPKNTSSSYSAEALIGNQMQSDVMAKRQNYVNSSKTLPVSSFLADNIIPPPYFPTVDLQTQDNNYIQQNQNYQTNSFTHNFTSFQNNTTYTPNTFIPTVSTITTSYLSTNNFMHDMPNHDYISDNLNLFPTKENKNYTKNYNRQNNVREEKTNSSQIQQVNCSNQYKKSASVKKKNVNEGNLPGLEFPFLSMSASINSPILPDEFHNHTSFLAPPSTPYPCKNPLYSKQNTELSSSGLLPPPLPPVPSGSRAQHPEISPSINTAGTSLTNFNLSAIFPEINKNHMPDGFTENRQKENNVSRSYIPTTSQVSFGNLNKSTLSFSSFS